MTFHLCSVSTIQGPCVHSKHTRDSGTVRRRDADVLVTVSGAAGLVVSDGCGGGTLGSGLTVPGRVRAARL